MKVLGMDIGEICNRDGCHGIIDSRPPENCSCHICPPCSSCTDAKLFCNMCGDDIETIIINNSKIAINPITRNWESSRPRDLDKNKIDWYSFGHTNFSMIKEGIYPTGTTKEQVLKEVVGSFGGRFEYFKDGKFKYIAYTD